ncbi:MAG TPA: polysaccharide pyruvyl transferase family protein [Gemmatimonadaceae bacterium]|nr:polysaccharide pyruvyl transferase family protein [Gemmatimonadaceae bacterium]
MKLVAPFGFYGAGNIGDESTLQGFARLLGSFPGRNHAWVASRDPAHTRRVERAFGYFRAESQDWRRRWAWMTGNAVVFPGGTPVMDALGRWPFSELVPLIERARVESKPIAFVGTGTERLRNADSRRIMAQEIIPHVTQWTVRSTRDRDRLLEYGVDPSAVTPTADLAWLLDAAPVDTGRAMLERLGVDVSRPLVGVNVNIEHFVREQQPHLLTAIAAFLDGLVRSRGVHVIFLCNEVRDGSTYDLAASQELIASMAQREATTIVPNEYYAPQVMLSLIGCCRATVSTRYHFCLFSALQRVPFLAVQRSDKVADLCSDLGWPHGVGLPELGAERLAQEYAAIDAGHGALREQMDRTVLEMRRRSETNQIALRRLAERIGR